MKRLFFLIVLCSSITVTSYAQFDPTEDTDPIGCSNGIDDDGDGFIDCFDSECVDKLVCDGGYVGNDAACKVVQPPAPKFTMERDYFTDDETANHLGRVVIGDLDRDGIPEMVTTNRYTNKILILNGQTGKIKNQVTTPFSPTYEELAIANIDDDNCAEIFVIDGSWNLYAYDCSLASQLWKVKLPGDPGMIGIADFESDGKVEIYVRDAVYDAKTGVEIIKSAAATAGNWDRTNGGPVAVDMDEDGDLDLVLGCTVYDVSLGARTANSGSLSIQSGRTLPQYFVRTNLSTTSVADVNLDGKLDVIASGSTGAHNQNTTVFFWQPNNGGTFTTFQEDADYAVTKGWKNGTGRINIADLDGDGALDVSYVSGKYLYALGYNGTNLVKKPWAPVIVNEETSGYTGCTLFDFNGDGQSEIVYRDEKFIYIINGKTGIAYPPQPCVSRTNREYPVVADVDADGSTEICVTCRTVDFYPDTPTETGVDEKDFKDITRSRYSQVRVFKSASEPWVPARRLWNQHGYFNVNVNDDLSIPKVQQKHHILFSNAPCKIGDPPTENRPLNSFLNQSPYIDVKGCPQYAAPNIVFSGAITANTPTCPNKDFDISFKISNIGDLPLTGDFPITFYKGDPFVATSTRLNTIKKSIVGFKRGDPDITINATVEGDGSAFRLYIVLNDMGTSNPKITLPNSPILDCPDDNVAFIDVNPAPAELDLTSTPNVQCPLSTAPANGTANASVPIAGSPNTTDFNFFWSVGNVVNNPVNRGPVVGGLASGDYTVYAVHKTANCSSVTKIVNVGSDTPDDPKATITELHAFTNCEDPDGVFDVSVTGPSGSDLSKYTFTWYETDHAGEAGKEIGFTHKIDILKAISYTVIVVDKRTGCNTNEPKTPTDNTPKFTVSLTDTDIDCSNTNNGAVASTLNLTAPAGYTLTPRYDWYRGNAVKPGTPDFPNASAIGPVGAGNYTLLVTDVPSGCTAPLATATVGQTLPPTITATGKNDQSSCNPSNPNGSAFATVDDQTKYTTKWYIGQGTSGAAVPGSDNLYTINDLKKGYYTIEIKSIDTECTATAEVFVDDDLQTLSITPAPINNTSCGVKTGSITVNGLPGADSDYTFFLDNGTTVVSQQGNRTFAQLDAGSYSVWAIHNDTECESNTAPSNIVTITAPITVSDVIVPASDCFDAKGRVTLNASGNTSGQYTFEWFEGGDTSTPLANPTHTQASAAMDSIFRKYGNYTARITDLDNGCFTENQYFIGIANTHQLTATKTDIDKCGLLTGGNINAALTMTTTIPGFSQSDYSIFVYQAKKDPDPTGTNGSPFVYSTVGAGPNVTEIYPFTNFTDASYTVVAVSNRPPTNGCRVSTTVKLNRVTTNPIVNRTVTPNTFCVFDVNTGVINGNGSITLAMGPTGADAPGNFIYEWTKSSEIPPINNWPQPGPNLPGPNFNVATSLSPGNYAVRVTVQPGLPMGGCATTKIIPVGDSPEVITIGNMGGSVTDCDANNGFAPNTTAVPLGQVNDESGVMASADFSQSWRNGDGTPYIGPGSGTTTLTAVLPGNYAVEVVKTVGGCKQTKDFTVENNIDVVGVDLKDFRDETLCINPQIGVLRVVGTTTSSTPGNFNFRWYNEPKPANYFTLPSDYLPALDSINAGIGQYTVLVEDANTNCWAQDTYTLGQNALPVMVTGSSTPLTMCDDPNGIGTVGNDASVIAQVILPPNPPPGGATPIDQTDYTFVWQINGVQPTTGPFATSSNIVSGLTESDINLGAITVLAFYTADPNNCISDPEPITVADERVFPDVSANAFAGVTTCDTDPTKADGVANADVGGNQTDYIFDWFQGTPSPVVKPGFFEGAIVTGLQAMTYTVTATDRISGCLGSTTVTIQPDPKPVALASVKLISNVTNCPPDPLININPPLLPNGSLQAVVDRPIDYSFEWSQDGVPIPQGDTTDIIDSLDAGTYMVTVTDRVTKCKATATGKIIPERVEPEFDFTVGDAACAKDNGFVSLFITNQDQIDIDSIWWDVTPVQTGPILTGVSAGTYTAFVLTRFGCIESAKATVNTDIHPYNGISTGTPGQNDYFHIDCIDDFKNNIVKIYNRAGTLVYEAEGYNNIDIMFDGKSNKGVSIMGTNLPDGTYFYVIDKRDGSKRRAGYLEIVN